MKNAVRLDLEFTKESWLREEFQFTKENGDLVGAGDKQYRFIAKESLETDIEIFNIVMPIVVHELDPNYWMAKVEIYSGDMNIQPDFLHYVIRKENPVEGNEDSDEIIIYGQITVNKRI